MGISFCNGRYVVTYTRRGEFLNYSCVNIDEAQAKLREMTEDTVVELTHRRIYFQDKQIMVLHIPAGKSPFKLS